MDMDWKKIAFIAVVSAATTYVIFKVTTVRQHVTGLS